MCVSSEGSSGSSEESECGVNDFCGDACLLLVLPARSVRDDEPEDEETLGAVPTPGGGWVVRARDDRRGDIAIRVTPCYRLSNVSRLFSGCPERCMVLRAPRGEAVEWVRSDS
jgi:hypothetical protein